MFAVPKEWLEQVGETLWPDVDPTEAFSEESRERAELYDRLGVSEVDRLRSAVVNIGVLLAGVIMAGVFAVLVGISLASQGLGGVILGGWAGFVCSFAVVYVALKRLSKWELAWFQGREEFRRELRETDGEGE